MTRQERRNELSAMTNAELAAILHRFNPFGGYTAARVARHREANIDAVLRYEGLGVTTPRQLDARRFNLVVSLRTIADEIEDPRTDRAQAAAWLRVRADEADALIKECLNTETE